MINYENGRATIGVHVDDSRRSYFNKWVQSAINLENQKCYSWMASFLRCKNPKRILDIGCGTASGLLALLRMLDGATIISIEENRFCLEFACKQLINAGYRVMPIFRVVTNEHQDGHFNISFKEGLLQEYEGITLIGADILLKDDIELSEFLLNVERFDAITVWLVGTHNARSNCLNECGYQEYDSYCRYVREIICNEARFFLNKGGVLHVVDRCRVGQDAKSIVGNYYERLAGEYNFEVDRIDSREYREISETVGVAMVNSKSKSRSSDRMFLVSALMIKK